VGINVKGKILNPWLVQPSSVEPKCFSSGYKPEPA